MTNTQTNTIDNPFERNDESDEDDKPNYPTSRIHFTPVIRKRSDLRETMLKNGPHNVSLLQLRYCSLVFVNHLDQDGYLMKL